MNKKLFIFILVIAIFASFTIGVFAEEVSILQTVKLKLMSDIRDSSTAMQVGIDEQVRTVVEQKLNQTSTTELDRALAEIQTYLNTKVQAVEDSPEVQNGIVDLQTITDIMIQEQKDAIDLIISNLSK